MPSCINFWKYGFKWEIFMKSFFINHKAITTNIKVVLKIIYSTCTYKDTYYE